MDAVTRLFGEELDVDYDFMRQLLAADVTVRNRACGFPKPWWHRPHRTGPN
jgi:hypothetical protein